MRATRHTPCLMSSQDRAAALPPGLHAAAMLVLVLLPFPGSAQTRDPQQAALDDFVAARMLTNKCPAWQIDQAEARTRFAELNLQPTDWQEGGRHANFFDERLSYYGSLLSRMPETRACGAAEEAFGPNGRVRKGWMKRQ
jgi:hypothetical protein